MSGGRPIIDEVDPAEAYRLLESNPETALIDVRTCAEWAFVGLPDLSALGRPKSKSSVWVIVSVSKVQ